jgi:putative DNA primase/helicase
MNKVAPKNRFKRSKPCPICRGFVSAERGKGIRCYGFLSDEGDWAHCTREEYRGGIEMSPGGDTYAHKLYGDCKCGETHNPAVANGTMKQIIKEYDYMDEHGELLYQVCRMNPKGFFQRRPDGNDGWMNNLGDVRRVLYRLPELLKADESETVFICEGEKDVDALIERGLVATTNAGGAGSGTGKWRFEYNEALRGRSVVILPDNDESGRQHAAQVARSLNSVGVSVRVVELPNLREKGDVSDWLAAGGTTEQLEEIAQATPEFEPSSEVEEINDSKSDEAEDDGWICAADVKPESVEWLWKPYIALGKITLFDGDPGVGKSWATCALAAAVSKGSGLPGAPAAESKPIIMLSAEDGLADTIRPRLDTFGADVSKIFLRDKAIIFDEAGLKQLEAQISKVRPGLVIIDPLFAYVGGKVDIYKDNQVRAILTPLAEMAARYGCALVALRHLTKAQQKAIYAGGGSMAFIGAARSALLFGRDSNNPAVCGFVHAKSNLAPLGSAVGYRIERTDDERGRFYWADCDLTAESILGSGGDSCKPSLKGTEAEEFLCEILEDGARRVKEINALARRKRITPATLRRAKESLKIDSGRPQANGPWWWKMPEDKWAWEGQNSDAQPHLFTGEHVPEEDQNRVDAAVKVDTQAGKNEHVVAGSRDSGEHVVGGDINPATTLFIDNKADAQKSLVRADEHVGYDPALIAEIAERAAIYEFEGGLTREQAEAKARTEVLADLAIANNDSGGIKPAAELFGAGSASIAA